MRLEILIDTPTENAKLLAERPQKDGSQTIYRCGLLVSGSWAGRLEQYDKFCETPIGEYILELEKHKKKK